MEIFAIQATKTYCICCLLVLPFLLFVWSCYCTEILFTYWNVVMECTLSNYLLMIVVTYSWLPGPLTLSPNTSGHRKFHQGMSRIPYGRCKSLEKTLIIWESTKWHGQLMHHFILINPTKQDPEEQESAIKLHIDWSCSNWFERIGKTPFWGHFRW